MYRFPDGLYMDVRIEKVFSTAIQITQGTLDDLKEKDDSGVFLRCYDGKRWYYSAITDREKIQEEIDNLAALAAPDNEIGNNPVVAGFQVNTGIQCSFDGGRSVSIINKQEKFDLLQNYLSLISGEEYLSLLRGNYIDTYVNKHFISSKGADLVFDFQRTGFRISAEFAKGERKFKDSYDVFGNLFADILDKDDGVRKLYDTGVKFLLEAVDVEPGDYPVVLSPLAAGVFAHESFGHKSEADFMAGDETMMKEWKLGKKVGDPMLSIVDDGNPMGAGYTPYDDEGTKAVKTSLIRNGILSGRLHSCSTAAILQEELTGNARSINFEYEPIVRMTTTYIEPGDKTLEELLGEIETGIFVESIRHGSGMSTFTLAPLRAYMIRDGKLAEPVFISVVSGSVFQTLNDIDGLSNELVLHSFVLGGCGKMEQFPLPVGFGGPYVRVKSLQVQ